MKDKFSLVRAFRHHNSRSRARGGPLHPDDCACRLQSELVAEQSEAGSRLAQSRANSAFAVRGCPMSACRMHPSGGQAYLGVNPAHPSSTPIRRAEFQRPRSYRRPPCQPIGPKHAANLRTTRPPYQDSVERQANTQARAVSDYQREAFNLMVSAKARRAFDLQAEPARLRDEYGRNTLGQSCLMARRLVEAEGARAASPSGSLELGHARQQLRHAAPRTAPRA